MGIFDFFRNIVKEKKAEEIVKEKLAFSDIEKWIERRIRENELKEKEILVIIRGKIGKLTMELREQIVVLESIDVGAKKEKDDVKGVVNNSRGKYIESVEDLIKRLDDLKEPKLEKFIEKINKIFFDFNKGSYKNYERATILIGKEMKDIKEGLKVFSKELIKTFDESRGVVDSFKKISLVKSKLDMILPFDKTLGKISETTLSLTEKIKSKEEANKKLLEEIGKIEKGSNYLERLRTQKRIESLKEELKNDIFRLNQLIDFKALTNFYHIFENEMNTIKEHRENFEESFKKDNGKMIIDFLDKAKLNNNTILEKVKQIRAKIEETTNHEKNLKADEVQEAYSKLKEICFESDTLKIEKAKEEKRDKKLRVNKEELINLLKQNLGEMNVEVI